MAQASVLQVVTANYLESGGVVYLTSGGTWRPEMQNATIVRTAGDANFLMAQAALHKGYVVEPYLVEVCRDADGRLEPVLQHERNRSVAHVHHPITDRALAALVQPVFTAL